MVDDDVRSKQKKKKRYRTNFLLSAYVPCRTCVYIAQYVIIFDPCHAIDSFLAIPRSTITSYYIIGTIF